MLIDIGSRLNNGQRHKVQLLDQLNRVVLSQISVISLKLFLKKSHGRFFVHRSNLENVFVVFNQSFRNLPTTRYDYNRSISRRWEIV
jgi:hypothetical protein